MDITQSKIYVQNEHKALMEKNRETDKTPEEALPFKHKETLEGFRFQFRFAFFTTQNGT